VAIATRESNPALPSALRALIIVEAGVLAVAGIVPFFFPETGLEELPWESGPFNIRFIGAVYLASLAAVLYWQTSFRWAPGRVALLMVAVFTSLVLVVTLFYTDRFDSGNPGTWIWFVLYVLIPGATLYVYLRFRHLPPAVPNPTPPAWRAYLLVTAALLGAYGIGLLVAPETFTDFWPWEVDAFHGRLYSAIIITLGVAALMISRVAAPTELMLVGLIEVVVGFFAILGLVLVDRSEDTVDWSALGTWVWVGAWAVVLATGLALVLRYRTVGAGAQPESPA
jgi:hypothetical protein